MPTYILSEDNKKDIAERYKAGEAVRDIAEDFGVSRQAIYLQLQNLDVPKRQRKTPPKRVRKRKLTPPAGKPDPSESDKTYEEIYQLRKTGLTWRELGDMHGRRADNIILGVKMWALKVGKAWPIEVEVA